MSEAFVDKLRSHPKRRIHLDFLREAFAQTCPELANAPDRSQQLLNLLRRLHDEGTLTLPAKNSWEIRGNPPMPRFVLLKSIAGPEVDYRRIAWLPCFGFWVQLNSLQLRDAALINEFLKKHPGPLTPVPLNERSLQIFGDEKRLSKMNTRGNALFGGRLPLNAIGAFHVAPPLPYHAVEASGAPLLVVENHHTYWSLRHWNAKVRRFAAVVFGSGNEFPKSAMLALEQVISESNACGVEYFGDIDRAGIAIPYYLSKRMLAAGKDPVKPSTSFYSWLLSHGRRQPCKDPKPKGVELEWLGEELQEKVAAVLQSDSRIPQESLSYSDLLADFPLIEKPPPPCRSQ